MGQGLTREPLFIAWERHASLLNSPLKISILRGEMSEIQNNPYQEYIYPIT